MRLILEDEGEFTFAAVASRDRLERAVTFFALLELHSSGEARLRQTQALRRHRRQPHGGSAPRGRVTPLSRLR